MNHTLATLPDTMARYGDKPALTHFQKEGSRSTPFKELSEQSIRLAQGLKRARAGQGGSAGPLLRGPDRGRCHGPRRVRGRGDDPAPGHAAHRAHPEGHPRGQPPPSPAHGCCTRPPTQVDCTGSGADDLGGAGPDRTGAVLAGASRGLRRWPAGGGAR
jgi:hypothetical protein